LIRDGKAKIEISHDDGQPYVCKFYYLLTLVLKYRNKTNK